MELTSVPEFENLLKDFKDWIKENPELPQNIENMLLLRFLKVSRCRLEKAQRLLRYSIQLRQENPHIFSDRDPLSEKIQDVFRTVDIVPLRTTTPDNYKIIVLRLISDDFDHIHFNDLIKAFFMMSDIRLITADTKTLTDGEIPIFDMERVSYRHLTKIILSTLRLYMKYTQEAHPVRVRQIHIINCNPMIDKIIYLIKPFVRTENFKMINFHTPGSTTLFKFIPKEFLPYEYGGTAGFIEPQKEYWMKKLKDHRDYLMTDSNWRLKVEDDNAAETGYGVLNFLGFF